MLGIDIGIGMNVQSGIGIGMSRYGGIGGTLFVTLKSKHVT